MSDQLRIPGDKKDILPYSRPITPEHGRRVGVYGLGAIGYHVARNLANSISIPTLPLVIYNRTTAKSEKLAKELGPNKISVAESPSELVNSCDIIFTILANDEVVKSAYREFYQALQAVTSENTKIFVESSTIYPTVAGELDNLISSIPHARFITCPVFGAPPAAAKGLLIAVMSGDYRAKKEAAHLLVPAAARKVIDLGGNIEKAPKFKLFGNSLIVGTMEVMAESLTLAEKAGVDSEAALSLLNDLFPAPMMTAYADKMANDKFDGTQGFSIDGGIKDTSHIRRLTSELNSPMPVVDIAHQHLLTARAGHISKKLQGTAKYETLDWSALVSGVRVAAGLAATGSGSHTGVVLEDEK